MTDGPMSPLCEVADACLTARTDMASFVDSLSAPISVINALLVALGLHRKEALSESLPPAGGYLGNLSVYLEEDSSMPDILVIGGGAAGMMAALIAAPEAALPSRCWSGTRSWAKRSTSPARAAAT